MKCTILRLPAVKSESGLSRCTIYLRVSQGLWTIIERTNPSVNRDLI